MPFKKGQSGNPVGRPRGARGKLTDKQLADKLACGTSEALKTVMDIMKSDKSSANEKLKAAFKWLDADVERRNAIQKQINEELKREAEARQKDDSPVENDAPMPVISLISSSQD